MNFCNSSVPRTELTSPCCSGGLSLKRLAATFHRTERRFTLSSRWCDAVGPSLFRNARCALTGLCRLRRGRDSGLRPAEVSSAATWSHTSPAGKEARPFIKLTARQQREQLKHPLPRTDRMQKTTSLLLVKEYISASIFATLSLVI